MVPAMIFERRSAVAQQAAVRIEGSISSDPSLPDQGARSWETRVTIAPEQPSPMAIVPSSWTDRYEKYPMIVK
jgi:hypothetical protein